MSKIDCKLLSFFIQITADVRYSPTLPATDVLHLLICTSFHHRSFLNGQVFLSLGAHHLEDVSEYGLA